jgi:protein-tyrosine phosphatase
MAGVSRSATICIAYIMVVTDLSWLDAMNAVKAARTIVEPNPGFQWQLELFGRSRLKQVNPFFSSYK